MLKAVMWCRHFQNDLTETGQHVMDPHKLKEAVVLLLQRHGGTGGSPSLLAQDVQAEFDRCECPPIRRACSLGPAERHLQAGSDQMVAVSSGARAL